MLIPQRVAQIVPQGVPGVLNFTTIYYILGTLAYRGRSSPGGVCGLSGRLRGAPGGTLETFWDLLGSSGSTFWEYFLSEKQLFAVSD